MESEEMVKVYEYDLHNHESINQTLGSELSHMPCAEALRRTGCKGL